MVSPFVSDHTLDRLSDEANASILVSRLESLDALRQSCREDFDDVYVLNPSAVPEEGGEELRSPARRRSTAFTPNFTSRTPAGRPGVDRIGKRDQRGFDRNVEFLVALAARRVCAASTASLAKPAKMENQSRCNRIDQPAPDTSDRDEPWSTKVEARLEGVVESVRRASPGKIGRRKLCATGRYGTLRNPFRP